MKLFASICAGTVMAAGIATVPARAQVIQIVQAKIIQVADVLRSDDGAYDRGAYVGPPEPVPMGDDTVILAPDEIPGILRQQGFSQLGPVFRRGWVYTVAVLNQNGDDGRLIVDARTGEPIRFVPAMRYIAHLVKSGHIGQPYHFRAQRFQDWGTRNLAWRQVKKLAATGELGDMLSHRIDFAHYLIGDRVERVTDPAVERPADVPETLRALPTVGRGPLLYPDLLPNAFTDVLDVDAAVLAQVALERIAAGEPMPYEALYLRRPDALTTAERAAR